MFNLIWESGKTPKIRKQAIVIPVKKPFKNSQVDESYLPISLTSYLGKLLETVMNTGIVYFLEKIKLSYIAPIQSGLGANRCTMDQLIKLENKLKQLFLKT